MTAPAFAREADTAMPDPGSHPAGRHREPESWFDIALDRAASSASDPEDPEAAVAPFNSAFC